MRELFGVISAVAMAGLLATAITLAGVWGAMRIENGHPDMRFVCPDGYVLVKSQWGKGEVCAADFAPAIVEYYED